MHADSLEEKDFGMAVVAKRLNGYLEKEDSLQAAN